MPEPQPTEKRLTVQEKLKLLFEEFGYVAVGIYFVIWVLTLGGIWAAMTAGWQPETTAGQAGTFGAAYLVFRATLPPRIAATLVLTPVVAKLLERFGLRKRKL